MISLEIWYILQVCSWPILMGNFKYHDLRFSICVSHLFPAYLSECVPCKLCLCLNVRGCLWLCALFFSYSLSTSPSLCQDTAWHLALQMKPGVYWSIILNQKNGWNTSRQAGKCSLFRSLFFTLNPGLKYECVRCPGSSTALYSFQYFQIIKSHSRYWAARHQNREKGGKMTVSKTHSSKCTSQHSTQSSSK